MATAWASSLAGLGSIATSDWNDTYTYAASTAGNFSGGWVQQAPQPLPQQIMQYGMSIPCKPQVQKVLSFVDTLRNEINDWLKDALK